MILIAISDMNKNPSKSKTPVVAALALIFAILPFSAQALKCWTTEDGSRACGDSVPPKYAQKGYVKKNAQGATIGKRDAARSVEEVTAEFEARKQAERDAVVAKKQAKLDQNLLDTFASEDDMLFARDGQVAHIESQIKMTENRNEKLQRKLDKLIQKAAGHERSGSMPPEALLSDIDSLQRQVEDNERFVDAKRLEQDEIKDQFDIDITRFRKLSENGR